MQHVFCASYLVVFENAVHGGHGHRHQNQYKTCGYIWKIYDLLIKYINVPSKSCRRKTNVPNLTWGNIGAKSIKSIRRYMKKGATHPIQVWPIIFGSIVHRTSQKLSLGKPVLKCRQEPQNEITVVIPFRSFSASARISKRMSVSIASFIFVEQRNFDACLDIYQQPQRLKARDGESPVSHNDW